MEFLIAVTFVKACRFNAELFYMRDLFMMFFLGIEWISASGTDNLALLVVEASSPVPPLIYGISVLL